MKIVFLLSRIPWPLDKGDKLRAYYQMKQISINHEITLIALTQSSVPDHFKSELKTICKEVYFFKLPKIGQLYNILKAFITGKPLQIGFFYNARIHKKIQAITQAIQPDIAFFQLVRMAEYADRLQTKKFIDYQDALSVGLERRSKKAHGLMKWILNLESKRMKNYEIGVFNKFDQRLIITETDRNLLPHPQRDLVSIIPNGVDFERFASKKREKIYDIIFAGNMNYPPNVDAVCFLIDEIMPKVWEKLPKTKVVLAGANPSASVKHKASKLVVVSGWVDDIATMYDQSKIFVAPMRIGTGLQNKLLEAMASNLPSITTPLANKALGALDGEQILIGADSAQIAKRIIELLENIELYESICENGYQFIKENYSWEVAGKQLNDLFENSRGEKIISPHI